jgi:hypothetical protein
MLHPSPSQAHSWRVVLTSIVVASGVLASATAFAQELNTQQILDEVQLETLDSTETGATSDNLSIDSIQAGSTSNQSLPQNSATLEPLLDSGVVEDAGQVTSVSQLSDVEPTDWAFQAVQSLVERYGCIAGYPDGTFRGSRPATRYELAAALNACLDNISDKFATKEDLEAVKALQEEFQAELATIRGRVDSLEARTSTLEAQQFSSTTKLKGEVIFAGGYVVDQRDATADLFGQDRFFSGNRVRLTLDTSFTGTDVLRVRLEANNTPEFDDETGTRMARLGFDGEDGNTFLLDELYYQFKPTKKRDLTIKIDANSGEFQDNLDTVNPFLESSGTGALSRFGRFNPIYRQGAGDNSAGVTINWDISKKFTLSAGFLADEPTSALNSIDENVEEPRGGLVGGSNAILAQLVAKPFKDGKFALTYVRSFDEAGNVNATGSTGSALARRPFTNDLDTVADHFGFQASVKPASFINLSGWVGYTSAREANPDPAFTRKAQLLNWAASAQFPDLFGVGNLGYILFGQPPKIINASNIDFAPDDLNTDGEPGTSYHLEIGYKLLVNKYITITPGVLAIFNPENDSERDNIFVPVIRSTFKF